MDHLPFVSTFVLKEYLGKNLRDFLFNLVMVRIMIQRGEVVLLRFDWGTTGRGLEPEPPCLCPAYLAMHSGPHSLCSCLVNRLCYQVEF